MNGKVTSTWNLQKVKANNNAGELGQFSRSITVRIFRIVESLREYMLTGQVLLTTRDLAEIDDGMLQVRHLQYMLAEVQNHCPDHPDIWIDAEESHALVTEAESYYRLIGNFRLK